MKYYMSIFKEKTIYKWMNEYNFERYYINLNHLQCTIKDSIKSWIMTWYHNADDRIEIEKFAWKDAGNLIAAISYLRKLNIRILSVKALTCLYFGPFLYFLEIFLVCAHTLHIHAHTYTRHKYHIPNIEHSSHNDPSKCRKSILYDFSLSYIPISCNLLLCIITWPTKFLLIPSM